jgi:hypothetical protein
MPWISGQAPCHRASLQLARHRRCRSYGATLRSISGGSALALAAVGCHGMVRWMHAMTHCPGRGGQLAGTALDESLHRPRSREAHHTARPLNAPLGGVTVIRPPAGEGYAGGRRRAQRRVPRRVQHRGRRPRAGPGEARPPGERGRAAELASEAARAEGGSLTRHRPWPGMAPRMHHEPSGDPGGQHAGGRHPAPVGVK